MTDDFCMLVFADLSMSSDDGCVECALSNVADTQGGIQLPLSKCPYEYSVSTKY